MIVVDFNGIKVDFDWVAKDFNFLYRWNLLVNCVVFVFYNDNTTNGWCSRHEDDIMFVLVKSITIDFVFMQIGIIITIVPEEFTFCLPQEVVDLLEPSYDL
ncbi:unnamed protein product [Bursaphelenchus okinawaensis]|uniref:Uncharacterized protein n=1 Tax=Bursaphelenchus okinawaensis TaxID=465554 RepID=A0A811JQW2_9BILA|nr:unnamed protein product [Bursaphelenchus okinawaensis]CAG9078566.1 unnamed protein product [Bursaphelenchus okinawaensis]